jgi:hypothetical protein
VRGRKRKGNRVWGSWDSGAEIPLPPQGGGGGPADRGEEEKYAR